MGRNGGGIFADMVSRRGTYRHYSKIFLKVSLSGLVIASAFALFLSTWLAIYRLRQCLYTIAALNALMSVPPVMVGLITCLLLSRSGPGQITNRQILPHGTGMSVLERGPV